MSRNSVKETVRRMLIQYPSLFHDKSDCFDHLFLVNGNGYDWVNGCLVDVHTDRDDEPCWADESGEPKPGEYVSSSSEIEAMFRQRRILDAKRENNQVRFVLDNFDAIYAMPVRFTNPDPVCEYSDLFHMPDDVQKDWQEACYESAMALQMWLNDHREPPIDDIKARIRERNRAFLHTRFADRIARMAEVAKTVLAKGC